MSVGFQQTESPSTQATAVFRISLVRLVLAALAFAFINASATQTEFVAWQEEVKLNDWRVVIVTQKKRCEGAYTGGNNADCIAREAWLSINLPEFSPTPIVWHEHLFAIVLNIHGGRLYVVGCPPTEREARLYGNPNPFYVGFVWEGARWIRIPFAEIPREIYDTNMFMEHVPPNGAAYLTVGRKESSERGMRGSPTTVHFLKRIDPDL